MTDVCLRTPGQTPEGMPCSLTLSEQIVEAIAEQAAAIVLERLQAPPSATSPYLTVNEATEFIRAKPQRIYDLLSARRLTRHKEGGRTLVLRAELESLIVAEARNRGGPGVAPRPANPHS